MNPVQKDKRIAFSIGGGVGAIFTRLPSMEDGNFLVTAVCVLIFGTTALLTWMAFKKVR